MRSYLLTFIFFFAAQLVSRMETYIAHHLKMDGLNSPAKLSGRGSIKGTMKGGIKGTLLRVRGNTLREGAPSDADKKTLCFSKVDLLDIQFYFFSLSLSVCLYVCWLSFS